MNLFKQLTRLAVLSTVMILATASGRSIDLRDYYPLEDGNKWTYQFRAFQPDGQIKYSIKEYTVTGDLELENGEIVKKLEDHRGWYYLLTIEKDRYLHWGEHENKGLVTNDPPFSFYDTGFTYGKKYAFAHAISDGSARGTEVVFNGYESIRTSAGEFKNCLKSTFTYINPNGSTFESVTWLAKGVGVVKKEFAIFSPKAGQTLRFDRELIHANINGQKVGGKSAPTVDNWKDYFPFYQGDSWTYDWTYTLGNGITKTEDRKREYLGTEFFDTGVAFKLIDNKGSYLYYSAFADRGIMIHGSFENRPGGQVFTYQPAIKLLRPDQVIGREYTWSEPEADQPENVGRYKRLQHWTSEVEGFQTLETPVGMFNVLRIRLAWSTSKSWVSQWYYLAENIGIVGMDYEAIDKITGKRVIGLVARIKEATLQGDNVTNLAELETHVKNVEVAMAKLKDDPKARNIFKAAFENRYTWKDGFPGLTADLNIVNHGEKPIAASITIDRNLVVDFECDDCGGELRSLVRAQVSQFVTHRVYEPFDEKYAEGEAFFQVVKKRRKGMWEITADGETAMGSWYLIDSRTNEVRQLTRTLGGPVKFMIIHEKNIITENGNYIANYYPVKFYIEDGDKKHDLGEVVYDDKFVKDGKWWLPEHRILKGKLPQPDMSVIDVDLELLFENVTYMQ
ncbi:MAG: DUF3386 family protein [Bacteroidetes bacterium]|nr:DUF3386 family protein [Bacteroidota bacterium]